jgi:hypothetical protein
MLRIGIITLTLAGVFLLAMSTPAQATDRELTAAEMQRVVASEEPCCTQSNWNYMAEIDLCWGCAIDEHYSQCETPATAMVSYERDWATCKKDGTDPDIRCVELTLWYVAREYTCNSTAHEDQSCTSSACSTSPMNYNHFCYQCWGNELIEDGDYLIGGHQPCENDLTPPE